MTNKILITGGCGFIGSHLTEHLVQRGYEVTVFDRYNSNNDWGWLENSIFNKDFNVILGDIRDYDSVKNAVKGNNVVLHLAALIGIPYSYISPLAYLKTNVEGTYNVLQSSKELEISKTVITSTSEVYGSAIYSPINEDHPLQPQSPYSASKIGADNLALSYYNSFDLPVTIIRPFNTYGPRQSARAIIPAIFSQLISSKDISLGNLSTVRDFTFVEDLCMAYEILLKNNIFNGEVVNVGSNQGISISQLIEKIFEITNLKKKIVVSEDRIRKNKSEVNHLLCDNKKILSLTDWKPKISLDDGLRKTYSWIEKNKNIYKSNLYNV